jgi:hypothetical protein
MPVKKIRACGISSKPIAVEEEIVCVIGKDEFLKFHLLLAQRRCELHRL